MGLFSRKAKEEVIYPKIEIAKILDQAFSLLFKQLPALLICGFLFALPYILMLAYQHYTGIQGNVPKIYYAIVNTFERIGGLALTGAFILVCRDKRLQSTVSWSSVLSDSLRQVHRMMGVYFLASLCFLLTSLSLFTLFPYVLVITSCTLPILLIERTSIMESFSRSRALTKGTRWRIFWLFISSCLMIFILGALMMVLKIYLAKDIEAMLMSGMDEHIPLAFLQPLICAFMAFANTFLYYDLRDKKEGLDLEALQANIECTTTLAAVQ